MRLRMSCCMVDVAVVFAVNILVLHGAEALRQYAEGVEATHVIMEHDGGNTTLNCTLPVSDPPELEWRRGSFQFSSYDKLYNTSDGGIKIGGYFFWRRFHVDDDDPRTLYVSDVTLNLAGVYTCRSQLSNGTLLVQHIHLDVVFGLGCSTWKDRWNPGDSGFLQCAVSVFRQRSVMKNIFPQPEVTWYKGYDDDAVKLEGTNNWPDGDLIIGSNYPLKVKRKHDGQVFRCQLTWLHYESECTITIHLNGGHSFRGTATLVIFPVLYALAAVLT